LSRKKPADPTFPSSLVELWIVVSCPWTAEYLNGSGPRDNYGVLPSTSSFLFLHCYNLWRKGYLNL
jgi:hypothetical protein